MTEKLLLIGSLSNDLLRVASLFGRGSERAATRFISEGQRWAQQLVAHSCPKYIQDIVEYVLSLDSQEVTGETAERCLMYGVLLQNFALKESRSRNSD